MPIDLLFIDTLHTRPDTLLTLVGWSKYVNRYISLHDYHNGFIGVVEAVEDWLKMTPKAQQILLPTGIGLIEIKKTL